MTIAEWLTAANQKIDRLDAELLLVHFLGVADRSYLIAHSDETLDNVDALNAQVDRRIRGEPLAYILGYREFYGRRFFVTPDVLIPRPETEDIITLAKAINPDKIIDIGTGSGCIAITLALELPSAQISAVDISDEALRIAQKNATHHHAKVNFLHSDLLTNYQPEPDTLIIANLPYVDRDWDWLNHDNLDYEPSLALYAEQNGLALIYKLIDQLPDSCDILLEADTSQHQAIIDYAVKTHLHFKQAKNFILYFTRRNEL